MPKPAFISYATDDAPSATSIRDALEAAGIACWMAPRDIAPGADYAEQIIDAIEACAVMVLVLSETSNQSRYVRNEVERAVAKNKTVIPVRIHNVTPSRSLEFFVSNAQWIDAWEGKLADKLGPLIAGLAGHAQRPPGGGPARQAEARPSDLASAAQSAAPPPDPELPDVRPPFVAREAQLAQLEAALALTLRGHGQLRLITGEAGAGKSALLLEFIHRTMAAHPNIVVAGGGCDAQTGAVDSYLPFRESLSLLAGGPRSSPFAITLPATNAKRLSAIRSAVAQAIIEHGPHLIDTLVPGALVALPAAARKKEYSQPLLAGQNVEQRQIFEQYVNVLRAVSKLAPLIVVLEDLHWVDDASSDLLFRLARQLEGSRILLLGAYRSEEVDLGRAGAPHPLEKGISELQRSLGEITIDLDAIRRQEGQTLVDALIDSEANQLDPLFRQALYQHTNGHPLFVVELLRDLERTGSVVKDADGRWIQGPSLDWDQLPARVEGIIAVRMARISDEQRRCLTIASVVGERFTAEVVAQVQGLDARHLILQLSGSLQKQHKLVAAEGVDRLATQRLTRYRFSHNLMQTYLYHKLDAVERVYLHEDVGLALEAQYGEQAGQIAVQLAYHFGLANVKEKAAKYLTQAGDQMRLASANHEALRTYQQALEYAAGDQAYESILARRAGLYLDLFRGKEALADYEDLLRRARAAKQRTLECEYMLGLTRAHYLVALDDRETGSASKMRALSLATQALASELGDTRNRILALLTSVWLTDFWSEERGFATVKAQEALALSRELGDEELTFSCRLALVANLGQTHLEPREALIPELESRRDLTRLNTLYFSLMWGGYGAGKFDRSVFYCDAGIRLAARIGVLPVMYPTIKALSLLALGGYAEARQSLSDEIADDTHAFGRTFKLFGEAYYLNELGDYSRAEALFGAVVEQAGKLERTWLKDWARAMALESLFRAQPSMQSDRVLVSELLARIDDLVLNPIGSHIAKAYELRAELYASADQLVEAQRQATDFVAWSETPNRQSSLVSALELQARLFLRQNQPAKALVAGERAEQLAISMGYLPMVWRSKTARARALDQLAKPTAAAAALQEAAATVLKLAENVDDVDLRRIFLASPLVASVLDEAAKRPAA